MSQEYETHNEEGYRLIPSKIQPVSYKGRRAEWQFHPGELGDYTAVETIRDRRLPRWRGLRPGWYDTTVFTVNTHVVSVFENQFALSHDKARILALEQYKKSQPNVQS